ncbi:MAG: PAS domain S-box protein [Acetobacteraceae bacterium]|nr:PAS domain S-box protein [Acetobacteraceae bacterium]
MLSLRHGLQPKSQRILDALDRSAAIIEFNLEGRILDVNEQFCRLMGYEPSEIVGQHHSLLVDPAYAASPAYKEFWDKLRSGEFESQEITEKVALIDTLLSQMAHSAREQAGGLSDVNSAVNRMDEVTQQNAEIIAGSTAAAATLEAEAVRMATLMA